MKYPPLIENDYQYHIILYNSNQAKVNTYLKREVNIVSNHQTLKELLMKYSEAGAYSGNVLVAVQGEIILSESYGMADWRVGIPLNEHSMFELASVSKPMTAMAILLLIQQNKLQLTDFADAWIDGFPYRNITIHHLLSHTSGLPDYMELMEKHWNPDNIAVNSDVIRLLGEYEPPMNFIPGSKYQYSNTGYVCLAEIIAKAAQMPYAEFLSRHLFLPSGMLRTKVMNRRLSPLIPDNFAYGWIQKSAGKSKAYNLPEELPEYDFVYYLDGIQGDGMTHSTVRDLFMLDRALSAGVLFSEELTNLMFSPTITEDGKENGYGYGWIIENTPNAGKKLFHSGGWPGYSTMFCRYPEKDACIILLSNLEKTDGSFHTSTENLVEEIESTLFT